MYLFRIPGPVLLPAILLLTEALSAHSHQASALLHGQEFFIGKDPLLSPISLETRAHWMRVAIQALADLRSPCPFNAFGTAIVNHTANDGLGTLVCIGANANLETGNPTLHGEIDAINNCTAILTAAKPYVNSSKAPLQGLAVWADLSLYTTAEACPMCASAIRWAGFKEYIFGTSVPELIENGWAQFEISSLEIFRNSKLLGTETAFVGSVLSNETDPYFSWQYLPHHPCPRGCSRDGLGQVCKPEA